jgi:hypothetical protein
MRNCLLLIPILCFLSCKEKTETKDARKDNSNSLTISGKLPVQIDSIQQINIMGFFVDPLYSGKILTSGEFEIILLDNFTDSTAVAIDKYNQSPEAQYRLEPTTIADYFSITDEIEAGGMNEKAALAGKYYTFATDEGMTIYPFSSKEFLESVVSGNLNTAGYYYYFLFSEGPFSLSGDYAIDLGTSEKGDSISQTYHYDVKGDKGWNILKYTAADVKNLNDSIQVAKSIKQESVKDLPLDLEWLVQRREKSTHLTN